MEFSGPQGRYFWQVVKECSRYSYNHSEAWWIKGIKYMLGPGEGSWGLFLLLFPQLVWKVRYDHCIFSSLSSSKLVIKKPCGFGTSKDVRGSTEVWHWRSHRKGSQIGKGKKKTQTIKKQTHNPEDFGMWYTLNRLWLNSMIYTWTWWLHRSFPIQIVLWFYEIWHLPTQVRNKTS